MNVSLRLAQDYLQQQAYAMVQRKNIENAPSIAELMKREQVTETPAYQQIKAVMLRMLQEYDQSMHYKASTVEEMYDNRGAVNALVEVLNYFETAQERRIAMQTEDTADTTEMGPSEAE